MVNATQKKFGHPSTVIADAEHWSVQLRPAQPTLGSLVLICTEPVTAFADLSAEAFAELKHLIVRIERTLGNFVAYERINYLMLMMVDPDVHFHVIPRYNGSRQYAGMDFPDKGWPAPPALSEAISLDQQQLVDLTGRVRSIWTQSSSQ
jgi:diadenosine tetraphosphate (Ap4A) HIT family hydrolase